MKGATVAVWCSWFCPSRRLASVETIGTKTLFIEPGSPWENGDAERFNGKLRDDVLNGEIFHTVKEAKVLIEQ